MIGSARLRPLRLVPANAAVLESRSGGWLPLTASECQSGLLSGKPEQRSHPPRKLPRSAWIWRNVFFRSTESIFATHDAACSLR